MINLTKPIETVEGGQPAHIIGLLPAAMVPSTIKPDENGFRPMMVWVDGPPNGGWGNVFLVNYEGFRVDDRALFSARQEPFIRNVKVKKEGWVLMRPSSASMDGRYLADDRVYASEAEAKSAKANWYGADPGVKPVHLTWEE